MTVTLFAWAVALYAAKEIDTWLASIAREAMRRADLTQDYISRVTGIPVARLSDQLSGKLPFTGLVRFGCAEIREETDFWLEFADVLAHQLHRDLVPSDWGRLIAGVEELVGAQRRMAKASLPAVEQKAEAV